MTHGLENAENIQRTYLYDWVLSGLIFSIIFLLFFMFAVDPIEPKKKKKKPGQICSNCFRASSDLWLVQALINPSFDTCWAPSVFSFWLQTVFSCQWKSLETEAHSPLCWCQVMELPWKLPWDLSLVNTHVWKNTAWEKMTLLSPHMQDASCLFWFVFARNCLNGTTKNKEMHTKKLQRPVTHSVSD